MKNFFKKIYEKYIKPVLTKVLNWLKEYWMQIVNLIIMFVAYGSLDEKPVAQLFVGLWLFTLLAYYIFIKLFGVDISSVFTKKVEPKLDYKPTSSNNNKTEEKPNLNAGMGNAIPPKPIRVKKPKTVE